MAEALTVESLTVRIAGRTLVNDVSLRAKQGQLLAVVGPNGAGKSTMLKALAGLTPHEGRVQLPQGESMALSFAQRARAIGYVPQRSNMAVGVSVYDVVAQARFAHGTGFLPSFMRRRDEHVERALARTDVSHLARRTFDTLSGGEQRRVLTARALASQARLLLLDEPTAGLDVGQVLRFFQLLSELRSEGYALVCVLHDLSDVQRHADRTLLLSRGRCVAQGDTREVLSGAHLTEVYGVHAHENSALGFSLAGAAE